MNKSKIKEPYLYNNYIYFLGTTKKGLIRAYKMLKTKKRYLYLVKSNKKEYQIAKQKGVKWEF